MIKWMITTVAVLTMACVVGCDREDLSSRTVPLHDDAAVAVGLDGESAGGNAEPHGVVDQSVRQFVDDADKRLKDHVIQIAGLRFLGDAYFDPQLVVNLEDKLAEGQKKLRQLRSADASHAQVIKEQLIALLDEMDKLYQLAMAETADRQQDVDDPDATEENIDGVDHQDDFGLDDETDDAFDDLGGQGLDDGVEDGEGLWSEDDESQFDDRLDEGR